MPFVVKVSASEGGVGWLAPAKVFGLRKLGPRARAESFKRQADAHAAIAKLPPIMIDGGAVFSVEPVGDRAGFTQKLRSEKRFKSFCDASSAKTLAATRTLSRYLEGSVECSVCRHCDRVIRRGRELTWSDHQLDPAQQSPVGRIPEPVVSHLLGFRGAARAAEIAE